MIDEKIILVVDDDNNIRRLIEVALSKLPQFSIKCVETGSKALEFLKEKIPEVIILDIVMPDMDGYSFLRKIKNLPDLKDIPVIISSGKSGMKEYFELEDEELRPDAFLAKPYKMKDLLDTVKGLA